MDNSILEQIRETLPKHEKIGIAIGRNPGLDEMGAALALYLSLKGANKTVAIASPTEPVVAIASLVGIDKVKTSLGGEGGDLIVSFPYSEGEIEKVSYTLESGYLNIVVKASSNGISFDERDVKYKRTGGAPSLLFVVGTPRVSDLGDLFNPEALKNTTIINIDNKASNQGFGDIVFVSQRFSSVSEQVAYFLQFLGISLDADIAQNLLSGICFATNNFQDPKTSYIAFEIASVLMKAGAQRQKIQARQQVRDGFSFSQAGGQQQPAKQFPAYQRRDQQDALKWSDVERNVPQTPPVRSQPLQQKTQGPLQRVHQPTQKQQVAPEEKDVQEAPPDWLTPKVYKGSTLV